MKLAHRRANDHRTCPTTVIMHQTESPTSSSSIPAIQSRQVTTPDVWSSGCASAHTYFLLLTYLPLPVV